LLIAALVSSGLSNAAAGVDPSVLALGVMAELNRVRENPGAYAEKYIAHRWAWYSGKTYQVPNGAVFNSKEGVAALDSCVMAMRRARPAPPLSWSDGLARAAGDHVSEQGRTGAIGHNGADGSTPFSRIERYGTWENDAGENIGYGNNDPREIVIQLLIDDGVPDRGHRANILDPTFRVVGIAVGSHPSYRYLCVMDFAGGFTYGRPSDR
jgi:uncharacterized protein YkwD